MAGAVAAAGVLASGCAPQARGQADLPSREDLAGAVADGPAPTGALPTAPATRELAPSEARRVGSVLPRPPEQVRLPGSEEWLPVEAVDTLPDGLLDVPEDVHTLGWWRGSARVGDPFGSLLLAGHVDSATQGLGDSAALLSTRAGDTVGLRTSRATTTYVVRSLRLVPRGSLAEHPELFESSGPARVTLVTCAPPYVRARGGYQNLAVVTARPVPTGGGSR